MLPHLAGAQDVADHPTAGNQCVGDELAVAAPGNGFGTEAASSEPPLRIPCLVSIDAEARTEAGCGLLPSRSGAAYFSSMGEGHPRPRVSRTATPFDATSP
jgi:hypothetical protein